MVWRADPPPLEGGSPCLPSGPSAKPFDLYGVDDVQFSPDEKLLLVSKCRARMRCLTSLLDAETGELVRSLPELDGPHPRFSPDGSWVVGADQLFHIPSGDFRVLAAGAAPDSPAIFTPSGDIIAGSPDGTLTQYCRSAAKQD